MDSKIKKMVLCAMFSALIAVGAFIKIPLSPIPVTMQMFFVILSGLVCGSKYGAMSAVVYMMMGLCGVPVFTEGGGIAYIFKPTFGYILGFILGAFITGKIAEKSVKPSVMRFISASVSGVIAVYAIGISYCFLISEFYIGASLNAKTLLLSCFAFIMPSDIVFCILASFLSVRLVSVLKKCQ